MVQPVTNIGPPRLSGSLRCLPGYAPELAAYHRAFGEHLRQAIDDLPLRPGNRVLDLACGDGTYSTWLAPRVGTKGLVAAVDLSSGYLDLARRLIESKPASNVVQFVAGHALGLPFADDAFDLAWCAQSLISLSDPLAVLKEMRRVVRPGGTVAVLENDALHHLVLPWPVDLELAVRRAEYQMARDEGREYYASRRLPELFQQTGLLPTYRRTYGTDRLAPLSADEELFLASYFQSLERRVGCRVDARSRRRLRGLLHPSSREYLLDRPNFAVTCLDTVSWGRKPREP